MRIDSIDLFEVRLRMRQGFETSSHRKDAITHVLVRICDTDGADAWGECAAEAAPYYGPETVETCWHGLTSFLGPALLEREWKHPREAWAALARFRGNHFAKAGLDIAVWDLYARRSGVSLAAALGGTRPAIESGVSLGIDEDEVTIERVREAIAAGHRRVKLKIRPGMAERTVKAVLSIVPADGPSIAVDANGAFEPEVISELVRLDQLGLALIEQPFGHDRWLAHRDLAAQMTTPVCLDESIGSPGLAELALSLHACDVMNIKVSRLGGLTPSVVVHDLCTEHGVPVWCGGMHEFGVGRAANVAIASLPGFSVPGDLSGSAERYVADIVDPPITSEGGLIAVPTTPGIGHDVDVERVKREARRYRQIRRVRQGVDRGVA
jgi:O-succinylbenzoate synthase